MSEARKLKDCDRILALLRDIWDAYGLYGDIPASLLERIEREVGRVPSAAGKRRGASK